MPPKRTIDETSAFLESVAKTIAGARANEKLATVPDVMIAVKQSSVLNFDWMVKAIKPVQKQVSESTQSQIERFEAALAGVFDEIARSSSSHEMAQAMYDISEDVRLFGSDPTLASAKLLRFLSQAAEVAATWKAYYASAKAEGFADEYLNELTGKPVD